MWLRPGRFFARGAATVTISAMESITQNAPNLSVSIVLHHSSLPYLQACLVSLQQAVLEARESAALGAASVVLVDNSCDASYQQDLAALVAAVVTALEPGDQFELRTVTLGQNLGFGHGHNSALATLDSDFHIVLNPDTQLAANSLRQGLSYMVSEPNIVLLSPKVTGTSGEQEFLCKRYPSVLALLLRGFAPGFVRRLFTAPLAKYEMRDICGKGAAVDVEIASGCFMLLRTAALRAVGGFHEDYFLYFEDFDLSLRLAKQGRLVFYPPMQIIHHGGYAATKGWLHVRYFIASGILFFRRHGWRWM